MKCQKCVEAGLESTIRVPSGGFSTLVAFESFYDKDGVYHRHDDNTHTSEWSCSNGHRWQHSRAGFCPAPNCKWNATRKDEVVFDK